MESFNFVIVSWLPHFGFSFLTLLVSYFALFFTLTSKDLGSCSYWDDLFDKYRVFLTANRIRVSEDIKMVLIKGDQENECLLCLSEFAVYYDLLISTKRSVQQINNYRTFFIPLAIIVSVLYASILVLIGNGEIKVSDTTYFVAPISFLITGYLLFAPIYAARHKIYSFVAEKSKQEKELKNMHGSFCDIEELFKT